MELGDEVEIFSSPLRSHALFPVNVLYYSLCWFNL